MRYLRRLMVWLATAFTAVVLTLAAEAPAKRSLPLVTTESKFDDATLIAADADWKWSFKTSDGVDRSFAAGKVVRFGRFVRPIGHHRLRLARGDEIIGYSLNVADGRVILESDLLETVKIPLGLTTAVIFDMPADPASVQALEQRIAAAPPNADAVLFNNGDQLAGRLAALAADKLTLDAADRAVVVDRSRVAAVVFKHVPPEPAAGRSEPTAWIGLQDGSRLLAVKFSVNLDRAAIQLTGGANVSIAREAIAALQPIGGDAVYLSDLDAAGYRHIPFLSLAWDYERDRNATGGPLVAGGELYLKGLGMHSAARITYNLNGGYRRFQSELAIDDSTGGRGSVICRMFLDDGSGTWQAKYDSPVIRGGEKPIAVDVDLTGAKRVSLLVDFADRSDEQDHVDWLDARLIK